MGSPARHEPHGATTTRDSAAGTPAKKIGYIIYVLANPEATGGRTVGYARVSSAEQNSHLENQANRLWAYAGQNGILLDDVVSEAANGLNDHRPKLRRLLGDPTVHTIIVEHRERLTRFGVGTVETMLEARGGSLIVIDDTDDTEVPDGLERDMTEIMACFCARLYGRRSAANRARLAMEATGG